MAVETKKTEKIDVSIKSIIHAVIMCALMFGFKLIPPFGTVTEYGVAVLGVFLGLLWGWTFLGILWPSLLGMFGLAFAGYGTVEKVALAMLNNSTVFMMLVGGIAFMCLGQSKAADWLMAKIVNNKLGKKSPVYTVMIIMFATLIINCMGATWIFLIAIWPIMVDMLKKCGYQRGEKFCIMFLTGYLASIQLGMAFKPFAGWGLMTAGTMQKLTQTEISYGGWMMTMVILIFVIGATYPFFMKLCGCDFSKLQDVDIVKTFGVDPSKKMNLTQKVVMTAMGIFLAVVIICSVFGAKLGPAYKMYTQITIGGFMVMFWIAMVVIKVDGKPMLDMKEAAKTFSWDMLFLIALALLISSVLTSADTGISA